MYSSSGVSLWLENIGGFTLVGKHRGFHFGWKTSGVSLWLENIGGFTLVGKQFLKYRTHCRQNYFLYRDVTDLN